MVPKIIHYCWFGRNPKPKLTEKCLKSWKKYCPDYKVMEWNEDNFDVSAAPLYVRQAYEAGKWAFVADFVRLKAMTEMGGIYMDTDVELVKPLDPFLKYEAFGGFETAEQISTGLMACGKGFPLFMEFLRHYDEISFLNPDGTPNVTTNVETVTGICKKHGLVLNGEFQVVDGLHLYPSEVFSPVSFETGLLQRTRKTVAIHWFSSSWYTQQEKEHREALRRKARRDRFFQGKVKNFLGEEGYERWTERLSRYSGWKELCKMPGNIARKLLKSAKGKK